MNKIWHYLIILGLFISLFTGEFKEMGTVILEALNKGFKIIFSLSLIMVLWNGVFNIAIEAGLINNFARVFKKPLKFIFPELSYQSEAYTLICANLLANILGISSASTPLGLKAMAKIKEEFALEEDANRTMETFVVLNCGSLSFIPLTLVSFRLQLGGCVPISLYLSYLLLSVIMSLATILISRKLGTKYYPQ